LRKTYDKQYDDTRFEEEPIAKEDVSGIKSTFELFGINISGPEGYKKSNQYKENFGDKYGGKKYEKHSYGKDGYDFYKQTSP
jgi:hypothetical protein